METGDVMLRWHVLRSKPRKEAALSRFAQMNGHEIFYPRIPVKPVNPRASQIRPYFPGYLFVRTDIGAAGLSTFRWMPFSQGLVHVGGEPAPVPDTVVRAIRSRVAEIWEVGGLVFGELEKGDRVIIKDGMFEGYVGIFDAHLPGKERVRILLKMLNDRFVPTELHVGSVEKLRAEPSAGSC